MRTSTRYLDGKSFETFIRGHRIVCDQPTSEGGADAGVTPPELLLASLGACAGHYAAEYLRAIAAINWPGSLRVGGEGHATCAPRVFSD